MLGPQEYDNDSQERRPRARSRKSTREEGGGVHQTSGDGEDVHQTSGEGKNVPRIPSDLVGDVHQIPSDQIPLESAHEQKRAEKSPVQERKARSRMGGERGDPTDVANLHAWLLNQK